MDAKLIAWARAVKARRAKAGRANVPVLWLFTDEIRSPDPRSFAARLPRGIAGVVFRHDHAPARSTLGRQLARICRERRLALVVAGDPRLARTLRAGVHLRDGYGDRNIAPFPMQPATSSAHRRGDLVRARRAGVDLVFLSPLFPTRSHTGALALGPARWAALARDAGLPVLALGGVDGTSAIRLARARCAGAAAIAALG